MSTATIANIVVVLALLGVSAPIARWLSRRSHAATARHNRFIRTTIARRAPYLAARWDDACQDWVNTDTHDVGPDQLRLIEDLEAHMKAYGATVADYYDTTTGDR